MGAFFTQLSQNGPANQNFFRDLLTSVGQSLAYGSAAGYLLTGVGIAAPAAPATAAGVAGYYGAVILQQMISRVLQRLGTQAYKRLGSQQPDLVQISGYAQEVIAHQQGVYQQVQTVAHHVQPPSVAHTPTATHG